MRRKWINIIMPNAKLFVAFGITSCIALSASLSAEEIPSDPPLCQVALGVFELLHDKYRQCQAQIEYKWSPVVYKLRPFVGLMATQRGSGYVYGGVGFDVFIGKRLVLTPSFAPGFYWKGNGKNLGFPLEFRSSLEGAVVMKNQMRVGLQFYHISNASLGHRNPGEESLLLFLSIPLPR